MTACIWRDVRLEVYSARVADLWPWTKLAPDHQMATMTGVAKMHCVGPGNLTAHCHLSLRGQKIAKQDVTVVGSQPTEATFEINRPELWWPNGYGSQILYDLSVSLTASGIELHHVTKRSGIRTSEVIQQQDKHGKFFFIGSTGFTSLWWFLLDFKAGSSKGQDIQLLTIPNLEVVNQMAHRATLKY